MACLLTIASAILASASVALAIGVCPTTLDNTGETYFTEYIADNQTTAYYAISLDDPMDQSAGNDNTNGCTTNPAYVTRYTDYDQDGCSFNAVTKLGTPTPIENGCYYEFTASNGDILAFNMSCYDSFVSYDDAVYITETAGKKRYEFTGYGQDMCQPTISTTQTDGPTQTWTDGPTQTYTDGPTQTYTDSPTVVYSYVSFVTSTYYNSYLVSYIRDYLNVMNSTYGTLSVDCNTTVAFDGNYTCIGTFSNFTQANSSVYGANNGYIRTVFSGWWYTPTTTAPTTPTPTTTIVYTNVTVLFTTSSFSSYLVWNIRSFFNISEYDNSQGTITYDCNSTRNFDGNYTCIVTFSNYTQASLTVYGAERGYIRYMPAAYLDGYSTTITITTSEPTTSETATSETATSETTTESSSEESSNTATAAVATSVTRKQFLSAVDSPQYKLASHPVILFAMLSLWQAL